MATFLREVREKARREAIDECIELVDIALHRAELFGDPTEDTRDRIQNCIEAMRKLKRRG